MNRQELLNQLKNTSTIWDIVVIGGGATGLGIALDSSLRGYKTLLLEQADFAKGTSSRSTKLIHGGVRYLAQGKIALVFEALKERGLLLQNAAHLVKKQAFIIPVYKWRHALKYWIGLKLYDLLAGKWGLGSSHYISRNQTIEALPTVKNQDLKGGILYYDSQFNDARLALNIAQSALQNGACILNYVQVKSLIKNTSGKIVGVTAQDTETSLTYSIKAKAVINATGVFADHVLRMDNLVSKPLIQPSQGIHLVLDKSFLPTPNALLIPETSDKRVLFAVPWQNHLLLGTTDTLLQEPDLEPKALNEEIRFILDTASGYLENVPKLSDVRAVFAGLRPLAAQEGNEQATKDISRNFKVIASESGLISVIGGKWTIYRKMAETTVNKTAITHKLPFTKSKTNNYPIHGNTNTYKYAAHLTEYGSDAYEIEKLVSMYPEMAEKLHPNFEYLVAQVVWAVRNELARTVEDVLARRLRLLFLNAEAAIQVAPKVAALMAIELQKSTEWQEAQIKDFISLAESYKVNIK